MGKVPEMYAKRRNISKLRESGTKEKKNAVASLQTSKSKIISWPMAKKCRKFF